jgi:hypothetical protein
MDERTLAQRAGDELRAAGFLVQSDVEIGDSRIGGARQRVDFVAWTPTRAGFTPAIVVEVTQAVPAPDSTQLTARLAAFRNLIGAPKAMVYDGGWWEPEPLRAGLVRTQIPSPSEAPSISTDSDKRLREGIANELWAELAHLRRDRFDISRIGDVLRALMRRGGSLTHQVAESHVGLRLIADAAESCIDRFGRGYGQYRSTVALNTCLAALSGANPGVIYDPFCGTGGTLRHAVYAAGGAARPVGHEVNTEVAELARLLCDIAGVPADITTADSLGHVVEPFADYVVTDPPIGLRQASPVLLLSGGTTKDGDVAIVDACLRALNPEGRAVITVPPSFLFRVGETKRYRRWLSTTYRLVAVIRLPAGVLPSTAIGPAILVIEKSTPSDTLFAVTGDDWAAQLREGGELHAAYVAHLESQ